MFTKKKIIVIGIMLLSLTFVFASDPIPTPHTGIVHTATWEDGYEQVYLYEGTYHFYLEAWVTTNTPGNLWIYRGIVDGEEYYSAYGEASALPVSNAHFTDSSDSFTIDDSGWYSVRCGAYAHYGVTMDSNLGSLICDYTPAWENEQ